VATTIAEVMVATLRASGIRRVYGIPGDSLSGFTDALRRDGSITWEHVRHEEAAAFAAAGETAVTGELAVCTASCGPGNRGKPHVEYDNPYDAGMTGLIGFGSGYRAMEHCDALVMLGTDFPYRPFLPEGVPVVQVDVRGERIGRRVPVEVPLAGTVKDTVPALLPLLTAQHDAAHPHRMTAHYGRARRRAWTTWPRPGAAARRSTRSSPRPRSTGSPRTTRPSPRTSARRASGPPATCG
jgi:thiamine pyrophosphate-dependent acetolactate synthase large subunit-like protein